MGLISLRSSRLFVAAPTIPNRSCRTRLYWIPHSLKPKFLKVFYIGSCEVSDALFLLDQL